MNIFNRNKTPNLDKYKPVAGERVSEMSGYNLSSVSSSQQKSYKLQQRLQQLSDVAECINLLINEHPDTSMAYTVLCALTYQGGKSIFSGSRQSYVQQEWESFCKRIGGSLIADGLDGLINQAVGSMIGFSGIGYEPVVTKDMNDIQDVYLVSPQTLFWKFNEDNKTWETFQRVNGKEINLTNSNFVWLPFRPQIGLPNGTYLFQSAIAPADMQLEFFNSSNVVLYRAGTPRYKVTIDIDKILKNAPNDVKSNQIKRIDYINSIVDNVKANLANIGVKNDFVVTSDTDVDMTGTNNSAFFQGISAYAELIDTQVLNGLKVLDTLMNRHKNGGSYALGTVEFKTVEDMLEPIRRSIKRMVENIMDIWLSVKGFNCSGKYELNPIDWQKLSDKFDYKLKELEYYRRADEYKYISPDEATQKTIGNDKAVGKDENLCAYVDNVGTENTNNDDSKGGENNAD